MSFANAAGAVGVSSTAADMARWLRMLLECSQEGAIPEGQTCLLKPESIRRLWSSQTVITPSPPPDGFEFLETDFAAYGLGLGLQELRGHKVVQHGGAVPGYYSRVTLVPAERLGMVVLSNQESGAALNAVTYQLLDAFLGAPEPPVDWLEAFERLAAIRREKAEAKVAEAEAARQASSAPSLAPSVYAGAYRDPWYGEATIEEKDGGLVLSLARTPHMRADLEHWQHDTFVARWRETWMSDHAPYDAFVTFTLGPDGRVERVTMMPVSPAIDFSFDFQDLEFAPVRADAGASAEP